MKSSRRTSSFFARADDADDAVAGLAQFVADGAQRGDAVSAAHADDGSVLLDGAGFAEGADDAVETNRQRSWSRFRAWFLPMAWMTNSRLSFS